MPFQAQSSMSAQKGHCYGFNIKNSGGLSSSGSTTTSKPAIITDRFQQTALNAPKKDTERGVQKGTGDRPNYNL